MSDFTIRPLQPGDCAALQDIAVAAWTPVFASFRELMGDAIFETEFPDWQADKRAQIASACRGEHGAVVLVAEADGQPVGFASYYCNAETRAGEISNNAVHPDYQGRGIATRLYETILDRMRDAGMDMVKVSTGGDASHAPARRAYEKAGFVRNVPSVTYFMDLRERGR